MAPRACGHPPRRAGPGGGHGLTKGSHAQLPVLRSPLTPATASLPRCSRPPGLGGSHPELSLCSPRPSWKLGAVQRHQVGRAASVKAPPGGLDPGDERYVRVCVRASGLHEGGASSPRSTAPPTGQADALLWGSGAPTLSLYLLEVDFRVPPVPDGPRPCFRSCMVTSWLAARGQQQYFGIREDVSPHPSWSAGPLGSPTVPHPTPAW